MAGTWELRIVGGAGGMDRSRAVMRSETGVRVSEFRGNTNIIYATGSYRKAIMFRHFNSTMKLDYSWYGPLADKGSPFLVESICVGQLQSGRPNSTSSPGPIAQNSPSVHFSTLV